MAQRIDSSLVSDLWFFRVAAEHGSFSRASEELAVTQSAVTQRIKRLEARLGVTLFLRNSRGLTLTPEGAELFRDARAGFELVAGGVQRTRGRSGPRTLSINCAPSLALEWLSPRLSRFTAAHPHLNITLFADMVLIDEARMGRDGIDVVIRYGPEPPAGSTVAFDFPEELSPVASADVLADLDARPERPVTLFHDAQPWPRAESRTAEWDLWTRSRGRPWGATRDSFVNLAHIAYQSAMSGGGIAMGRGLLVASHLASGRLRGFAGSEPVGGARYFVSGKPTQARDDDTAAFIGWLHGEMAQTRSGETKPS